MNANDSIIIDVTPLKHSRTRSTSTGSVGNAGAQAHRANATGNPHGASSTWSSHPGNPYGASSTRSASAGSRSFAPSLQSRAAGLVQMLLGTLLVMIGIPMLILPGPGLLSIFAGLAIAASGYRKLLGAPMASWFTMSQYPR